MRLRAHRHIVVWPQMILLGERQMRKDFPPATPVMTGLCPVSPDPGPRTGVQHVQEFGGHQGEQGCMSIANRLELPARSTGARYLVGRPSTS
jgi:hypothetical protein